MVKINKYFELHITVKPIGDVAPAIGLSAEAAYKQFRKAARDIGWKTSMFDHDDVDDIAGKWFATRHAETKGGAKALMKLALDALNALDYQVTRWKIEKIIVDSKYGSTVDDLA